MNAYATEEEQLQALTDFLKKHGITLVTALLLFIASVFGWQYWQQNNVNYTHEASVVYEQLRELVDNQNALNQVNDTDKSTNSKQQDLINTLTSKYPATIYGKIAKVYSVNQLVTQKKWQEAAKQYEALYSEAKQWPELQIVVFENWNRSLLEQQQYDKALVNMQNLEDSSSSLINLYPLNFYNLKGDVLAKQGKNNDAIAAYDKALLAINTKPQLAGQYVQFANWINLKRNDLKAAQPLQ